MCNINKYYADVQALVDAKLDVSYGEVHALIGANGAGKSTLMKVLCGEIAYESGTIEFEGKEIKPIAGKTMMEMGIVMIHQELCTIPNLNVAEYIFLGREFTKHGLIDDEKMVEEASKLLEKIEADFSPLDMISDLSMAHLQQVEIAKALSYDLKLLILDEPTTALGEKETKKIFEIIEQLKQKNISVIFISHRLEELLQISDRISIMRDGKYIDTLVTKNTEKNDLVRLLAGRDLVDQQKSKSNVAKDAKVVLEVNNLSTPLLKNVSFNLKQGEILGLAGLSGSGRSETAKAICGIDEKISGDIYINGQKVKIDSPKKAKECGICYVSEDRNIEGFIGIRSIIQNTTLSSLEKYENGLALNDEKMLKDTLDYNKILDTKYADPHAPISSLSGGNAQKVIIAKWLINNPQIFIFDEPTKGIDIQSKDEIYKIINNIVKDGHSIILISSETKELLNNCDRLVVLNEGKVTGELMIEDVTQSKLVELSTRKI